MYLEDVVGKHGVLSLPVMCCFEHWQLILLEAFTKMYRNWHQLNVNSVYAEIYM